MTTETTTVEQTASTPVPAETTAPAPVDETKASETVNTDTPADTADPADPEAEKRRKSAKDRINELTRKRYEAENRASEAEKRLQELESRYAPQELKEPKLADFESDADFVAAVHKYQSDKLAREATQSRRQETQQQEAQRKQAETAQAAQKFVTDLNKSKESYQDIDSVMADPAFALITKQMAPELVALIQTSDKNVALAYHLGTHLDEAERIASLPPVRAARELALLESRLEIPKPKTVTNAPPPVKTVKGSSVVEKDISDPNLPDAEFNALRRKQKAAKGGR